MSPAAPDPRRRPPRASAAARSRSRVDDHQLLGAQPAQRVRQRRARAAGAEQDDRLHGARRAARARTLSAKPLGVGVVPGRAAVADHDRVDRADRRGVLVELVEMLEHRLLARVGDVQPVVPGVARAREQLADAASPSTSMSSVRYA